MMNANALPERSVEALLSKGPDECLKFIGEHFPTGFDWLDLAEGAAFKSAADTVLAERPSQMGLDWIRVAVDIYEHLADHPGADHGLRVKCVESAIAGRAKAIGLWGEEAGDPVRDLDALVTRFLSIMEVTPEELRTDDKPLDPAIGTALLVTQFIEPLLKMNALKARLFEIAEYCEAARDVRERTERLLAQ